MVAKKELGKLIKSTRKKLGVTQKQLSEIVGLSRNYVSDIENGRYTPSVETMSKIAIYLNIDLNELKNFALSDGNTSQ